MSSRLAHLFLDTPRAFHVYNSCRPIRLLVSSRIGLYQGIASVRGAKTTTKTKLKSLPQGALAPLPDHEALEKIEASYPPVIQQHLNNVKKFSDCVVLTRVGNFYELYAEQAEQYGPLLNLKVAQRRTSLGPVAMSGFQIFQLDRYLKMLVQDLNKQVAISEETRNSAADQVKGGLLYSRKVTRVITAGTLIDENFVDPYDNNFLLSIHVDHSSLLSSQAAEIRKGLDARSVPRKDAQTGLSWVDLSSGDFYLQRTDLASLGSVLARIAPREIVLDVSFENVNQEVLKAAIGEGRHMLAYHGPSERYRDPQSWDELLDRPMTSAESGITPLELDAGSLLLDYVREKLLDLQITLRPPVRRSDDDNMRIDKQSLRGLEIRETLREGGYAGSLLHAIRRTVTKSGARLLSRRLVSPSMSVEAINGRLDLIDDLLRNEGLREDITSHLRRSSDMLRILQKFSIGRGDADDMLALAKTIAITQSVSDRIEAHVGASEPAAISASMVHLLQSFDQEKPQKLMHRIMRSIDEDSLSRQHQAEEVEAAEAAEYSEQVKASGRVDAKPPRLPVRKASATMWNEPGEIWTMKRGASSTLNSLHEQHDDVMQRRIQLGDDLRKQHKCNSLTLRWSPQLGHYCHVKNKDCKVQIEGTRNISSTKTTRSFYLPEWTELGLITEEATARIRTEEQRVFSSLRNEVIQNLVKLRRNASVLDELDVACSSAVLAQEHNLTRPIMNTSTNFNIVGGRHSMVDEGLKTSGRSFTSNDCSMTAKESIFLITGPNMAGKSTFLRQNALISILAQTGCFVPADYAEIGLVDKIFSRIGSADNVSKHQSTFMVEMLEVAEILQQATPRSFVIMDEVGRGTTPEDGIAVGYACLHHLHEHNKCRTLFATHFHVLADMTRDFARLSCWCTDVAEETDGSWVYVHKMRRGVNRESHALKVARLAGLPEPAIQVASDVLQSLRVPGPIAHRSAADIVHHHEIQNGARRVVGQAA